MFRNKTVFHTVISFGYKSIVCNPGIITHVKFHHLYKTFMFENIADANLNVKTCGCIVFAYRYHL